jgi:hypothetical protein
MSNQKRALLIALLGPALQVVGLAWTVLRVAFEPGRAEFTVRYLVFDPGHLLIAVGLGVSIVCAPVVVQVAMADRSEVEVETFGIGEEETADKRAREATQRRWEVVE